MSAPAEDAADAAPAAPANEREKEQAGLHNVGDMRAIEAIMDQSQVDNVGGLWCMALWGLRDGAAA